MKEDTPAIQAAGHTPIEADAARLLRALATHILADGAEVRLAQRYGERLRFALARVQELRLSANGLGGVFEPARLEVSFSILENHVRQASAFADRILARTPKHVASRYRQPSAVEAIEDTPAVLTQGRAA